MEYFVICCYINFSNVCLSLHDIVWILEKNIDNFSVGFYISHVLYPCTFQVSVIWILKFSSCRYVTIVGMPLFMPKIECVEGKWSFCKNSLCNYITIKGQMLLRPVKTFMLFMVRKKWPKGKSVFLVLEISTWKCSGEATMKKVGKF